MNPLEEELTTSLRRQVDTEPAGSPITLDDVLGRARQIRRRRRIAAGVAVAAAVAVIAPAGLLLANGLDRAQAPDPVGPAPVQVTPDHARAGGDTLDFTNLPQGEAPLIGYLDLTGSGDVIVTPGGNEVVLDTEHEPLGYTSLTDGRYVVVTADDGGTYVEPVDSSGSSQAVLPTTGGLVVDQGHGQVAWANSEHEVMVLQSGQAEARVLGTVPDAMTVEVVELSGPDCFRETLPAEDFGCIAYLDVTRSDGTSEAMSMTMEEATSLGGTTLDFRPIADTFTAGDPQSLEWTSYTAGIREVRPDLTVCSGVHGNDAQAPESQWLIETCDHTFDSFSPDGGTLLAWESYGDGAGHYVMGLYDMESRELLWERSRSEQTAMSHVHSAEWESDDQLLAPVWQDGEWQLVRFSRDGAMERVAGPVEAGETGAPFVPEIQG